MNPITFEMLLSQFLSAYVASNIEGLVGDDLTPELAEEHVANLFALAAKAKALIEVADKAILAQSSGA